MPKKSVHNSQPFVEIFHLYNLLDLLKLTVVNNQLIIIFISEIMKLLRISSNMVSFNILVALLMSIIFTQRAQHLETQRHSSIKNQEAIDEIDQSAHPIKINANYDYLKKHLIHHRHERMLHILMVFVVNLGMFYIASYEIIQICTLLLPTLIVNYLQTIPYHNIFISIVFAYQLASNRAQIFAQQQLLSARMTDLITRQKIIIKESQEKPTNTLIKVVCAGPVITTICIAAQAPMLTNIFLCLTLLSIGFITLYRINLSKTRWLPYISALSSGISTIGSILQITKIHPGLLNLLSIKSVGPDQLKHIFLSIYSSITILYSFSILRHEKESKTVEKIINSVPTSSLKHNQASRAEYTQNKDERSTPEDCRYT